MNGVKQSDLAREVGISASYLNLIEHNRRRIGGKLLTDIAMALRVEPALLSEGAEAALIASLREAADDFAASGAELDSIDEFTGRFPGWAEALATAHRRIGSLERVVETLSDRLSHDPNLATSLHELLSTAAAIRSTAAILAETTELEPRWRDRFHKNLNQDSARLSDSSKALVRFLDETGGDAAQERRAAPREDAEAMFAANDHHFPQLEAGASSPAEVAAQAPMLHSQAAQRIATDLLETYAADARALPLSTMQRALKDAGLDVPRLTRHLNAPLPMVLRRIASLPPDALDRPVGLVICDNSGAFLFRKRVDGFSIPQFGASCPLWPLFSALARPTMPFRRVIRQFGRMPTKFDCFAVAVPHSMVGFESDPVLHATMLVVPTQGEDDADVLDVGTNCRICQKDPCSARREPSALSDPF